MYPRDKTFKSQKDGAYEQENTSAIIPVELPLAGWQKLHPNYHILHEAPRQAGYLAIYLKGSPEPVQLHNLSARQQSIKNFSKQINGSHQFDQNSPTKYLPTKTGENQTQYWHKNYKLFCLKVKYQAT